MMEIEINPWELLVAYLIVCFGLWFVIDAIYTLVERLGDRQ